MYIQLLESVQISLQVRFVWNILTLWAAMKKCEGEGEVILNYGNFVAKSWMCLHIYMVQNKFSICESLVQKPNTGNEMKLIFFQLLHSSDIFNKWK